MKFVAAPAEDQDPILDPKDAPATIGDIPDTDKQDVANTRPPIPIWWRGASGRDDAVSGREDQAAPELAELWAEIVTEVGSGAYTFKEKELTDGTTWVDVSDGLTGTVYEINDQTGIAVGDIIHIFLAYDTNGDLQYIFGAGGGVIPDGTAVHQMLEWDHANGKWIILAAPDTDYKVLQRKADDSIGWDWVRAH